MNKKMKIDTSSLNIKAGALSGWLHVPRPSRKDLYIVKTNENIILKNPERTKTLPGNNSLHSVTEYKIFIKSKSFTAFFDR